MASPYMIGFLDVWHKVPGYPQILNGATSEGEAPLNEALHRLSPVIGLQSRVPSLRSGELPLHDSVPMLVGLAEEIGKDGRLQRELRNGRVSADHHQLSKRSLALLTRHISERISQWNPWQASNSPKFVGGGSSMLEQEGLKDHWSFTLDLDQARKLAATLLCEGTRSQLDDILWVYLNRIERSGFEAGLKGSNAYRRTAVDFKFWMTYLGDPLYKNSPPPDWDQIRDKGTNAAAVASNNYSVNLKAENVIAMIDLAMKSRSGNPYEGFTSQGDDVDIDGEGKWEKARMYLLLQERGFVKQKYVEVLYPIQGDVGSVITLIFDETKIEDYFTKHPEMFIKPVPTFPFD
jgi:hypothetical protein